MAARPECEGLRRVMIDVRTRLEHRVGLEERLVVMLTVEAEPKTHYVLGNAAPQVTPEELVRARFSRHKIEEVFEAAKHEAGLRHYEVRGWVGWHHHVTLSLLALWFLCCERPRVGGETRAITVSQVREVFARLLRSPAPDPDRIADEISRALWRKQAAWIYQLAQGDRRLPAAPPAARHELIV